MIKPSPLKIGDTIGVMAPSSYVERADIEAATSRLEKLGYKVFVHEQTYARHNQSAGTDAEKVAALNNLCMNPDIAVIWAAGGGNRALNLISQIDYETIKSNPKIFIGFSDFTAILNSIYAQTGLITYHGPVFKNLASYDLLEDLITLISGNKTSISLQGDTTVLKEGQAQGPLIGGNLSLFQYLPAILSDDFYKDGILFLEDCHEELSRIDRMLSYLKQSGVFGQISGLILGEFSDLTDSGRPFGFTFEDVIREYFDDLDIPIIINAPFGHKKKLISFPVGHTCNLSTNPPELSLL